MSKCPKCDTYFTSLVLTPVNAKKGTMTSLECISLDCPHCSASLSVTPDPIRFAQEVAKHIRR